MNPGDIQVKDYTYLLPEDRIALYPLPQRDESKLLVYQHGTIHSSQYKHLTDFLPENSCLFFNNTRVVQARLKFMEDVHSEIELFCLEPHQQEVSTAMGSKAPVIWKCFVGRIKKWKSEQLVLRKDELELRASLREKLGDSYLISFTWNSDNTFSEILTFFGQLPIPPYLKRTAEASDAERYQTVYAHHEGSVAAPTAGLHFTPALLDSIRRKKISTHFLTLHVGAGTFKPVKAETLSGHSMHSEWIIISADMIQHLLLSHFCIPVGTTSMRTLESIYWMGLKAQHNPDISLEALEVKQWEPYELPEIDPKLALEALLLWLKKENLDTLSIKTSILIAPGYQPKIAKALITNFHQPESTLILLVAACLGEAWKTVYQYALDHEYRFLSYGDGSLLFFDKTMKILNDKS